MREVQLELYPALGGDCILISFEEIDYRILIDGGYKETFSNTLASALRALKAEGKGIDLLVVTHVDNDHIMGIIGLFQALKIQEIEIEIREIWYNGYRHLFTGSKQAVSPVLEKSLGDEIRKIDFDDREARQGKEIGYSHMLLDTLPFLEGALHLYEKRGFYQVERYNDSPLESLIYMRLDL